MATPQKARSEVLGGRLIEVYRTREGLETKVYIGAEPVDEPLSEWVFDRAYGLSVFEAVTLADMQTPQPVGHEHKVDREERALILIRQGLLSGGMGAARRALLDYGLAVSAALEDAKGDLR